MKRRLHVSIAALAMIGLMFSCSTSNDVASKRGIQKRKYNKGYFVDFDKKFGKHNNQDEVVTNDEVIEENDVVIEETSNALRDIKKEVIAVQDNAVDAVAPVQEKVEPNEVAEPTTTITNKNESTERLKFDKSNKSGMKIIKSDRKFLKQEFKEHKKTKISKESSSEDAILYYILAILIPFLAVGLVTDWDLTKVIICLLLCFLFYLPGMIYALIVVSNNV